MEILSLGESVMTDEETKETIRVLDISLTRKRQWSLRRTEKHDIAPTQVVN